MNTTSSRAVPSPSEIDDALEAILTDRCGPGASQVGEAEDLGKALALDSLDRLDLIAVVEDAFDVRLPDEVLRNPTTRASLRSAVQRLLRAKTS